MIHAVPPRHALQVVLVLGAITLAPALRAADLPADADRIAEGPISTPDYLGQSLPGTTAVVFAPGIVSDGRVHGRLAISPDGRDLFWTTVSARGGQGVARIMHIARTADGWTAPTPASFAVEGNTANPVFSPDGNQLFFNISADRARGWQTRFVERTAQGWSESRENGLLNPTSSFTKSGRVYYTDRLAGKPWNRGIHVAEYDGGTAANPRPLPVEINSPFIDYTPFIAPDESYLVFCSSRPSTEESMFLHVSFRNQGGTWSTPVRMNDALGFAGNARFPSLSPDGCFLFFCGDDGNIYWVSSGVVDRLRQGETPRTPGDLPR